MFRSNSEPAIRHLWATPTGQALALSALCLVGLSVAGHLSLSLPWVPALAFGVIVLVLLHPLTSRYPHPVLGLCNVVTLLRAALVAFLFGAVVSPGFSAWLFFALATATFAMDGLDGWLARRAGLESRFGARFDMEVDAILAAVLALWLLVTGITGPQILILGFTRYVFVAAAWIFPPLREDLPESFRRKAICVLQIATLIILLLPITPAVLVGPWAAGVAVLLLWSFAIDIAWLLKRRRV